MIRLAYLVSHPIQYQAPLFRQLAREDDISLDVYFRDDYSTRAYHDDGFGSEIRWDTPLVEGYRHHLVSNWLSNPLTKTIREGRVDVLWVHGYADPFYFSMMLYAKLHGVKVMVRSETTDAFKAPGLLRNVVRRFYFGLLKRLVDAFLAIGTLNRRFFLARGVHPERIFLSPYSVDNGAFHSASEAAKDKLQGLRDELGIEPNAFIILYSSKFIPRKHASDLLSAYSRLIQDSNLTPYLIYIGDGEERVALEARVKDEALSNVRFLGFINQSELPNYYQLCDVFVLPSERENWGLVVNEVMNASKPVIASDQVGSGVDLIEQGVNGYIYPARDIGQLTSALKKILTMNTAVREKMGANSLDKIRKWGIRETIDGFKQAYRSLISSGSVRAPVRRSDST